MTSWMKERDRLVEQTLAFVQGVAAQRPSKADVADTSATSHPLTSQPETSQPETKVGPVIPSRTSASFAEDTSLADAEAMMSLIASSLPSLRSKPADSPEPAVAAPLQKRVDIASVSLSVPSAAKQPEQPSHMALPERDMIAQRVANFRAGQQKLMREREDHYATVQAKIRATLDPDSQP